MVLVIAILIALAIITLIELFVPEPMVQVVGISAGALMVSTALVAMA